MKIKKLIILIFIALALLITVLVKKSIETKRTAQNEAQEPIIDLSQGLSEGFISRVTIYKGQDAQKKIVLSKQADGAWALENKFGVKARQDIVANLLADLTGLSGELRADSAEVLNDFAIGDAEGAHIILDAQPGQELKHLVVSFSRPSWNKNFVRLYGSGEIVLAGKDILSRINLFNKDAVLDDNYFADLKVFSFEKQTIDKLELGLGPGSALVLVRGAADDKNPAGLWGFSPPEANQEIDAARVDEFLQNIVNIYAQEYFDPNGAGYGLANPLLRITLGDTRNNKQFQLTAGSYLAAQKSYYAQANPQNTIFRVPESSIQNLQKDKRFFLKIKEVKKDQEPKKDKRKDVKKNNAKKP